MAKCKTVEKGDVQIEGVEVADGIVFRREYLSHKKGPAIFYNNRHGGQCTVYPEHKLVWPKGADKPRKFKSEKKMDEFTLEILNTDNS